MVDNPNYLETKNIYIRNNLHPWFVTGYSDGESSFSIRLRTNLRSKLKFHISIVYSISAQRNPNNKKVLELVKDYFNNEGSISKSGNMYVYQISTIEGLKYIRKHFENFPLQTTKYTYFRLWCQVMDIIENKEHLTKEGFLKILSIKNVFPKGLSNKVLRYYPDIFLFLKPIFEPSTKLLSPYWITGFVQADGTFGLNFTKQRRMILGYTCQPQFRISQHERDLIVLKRIIETLGCGILVKPSLGRNEYTISVGNLKDLVLVIIPFFKKYSLYGAKLLDFNDFCDGIFILKNKGHLSKEGLNQLKILTYRMNTYRKFI